MSGVTKQYDGLAVLRTIVPQPNSARATTIREYLLNMLARLWSQKAGFRGKYPLGDSGWVEEIAYALVNARKVDGCINEDEELMQYDKDQLEAAIEAAIEALR